MFESMHPYQPSDHFEHEIYMEGARAMKIVFSPQVGGWVGDITIAGVS
jgi:hypothetical protein